MAGQWEEAAARAARKAAVPRLIRALKWLAWFCRKKPLGAVGMAIILAMIVMAVAAPFITFYDTVSWNLDDKLVGPSASHWLGTDDYGRDLWTRLAYGARTSLIVGFGATMLGTLVGGTFGLVSAYYGGKVDQVIQRMTDALMAIPTLIMALVLMAALGQSLFNVILAVGISRMDSACRIVRSQALSVVAAEYALAARAIGASSPRIMFLHIMPQCLAPWIIMTSAGLGAAILAESSLSFLGLGVPPPAPSWGGMLSGPARDFYAIAPWLAIWPGVALSLAIYGFNLFGDSMRDVLDPRLRGA